MCKLTCVPNIRRAWQVFNKLKIELLFKPAISFLARYMFVMHAYNPSTQKDKAEGS